MKTVKITYFFILLFCCFIVRGQLQWNSNKDRIVIPFDLVHNLILIKVELNGVELEVALDIGSEKIFCLIIQNKIK